jgi:hypothetical protein
MAKKRIMNLAVVGQLSDLVEGNFMPLDGPGGTKKIPAQFVHGGAWTFWARFSTQLGDYDWPDPEDVRNVLSYRMTPLIIRVGQGTEILYKFVSLEGTEEETVITFVADGGFTLMATWSDADEEWTWSEGEEDWNALKDGGSLTDGAVVNVRNNALNKLTTAQANLTLNVLLKTGEVPNFAVEITAGADVTLSVTKKVGNTTTALKQSKAGGNALENGKSYQVTCVGSCWTLAEFEEPSA